MPELNALLAAPIGALSFRLRFIRKVLTNHTKPVLVSRKDFLVVVVVQFCVPGVPIEDGLGTVFRSAVRV